MILKKFISSKVILFLLRSKVLISYQLQSQNILQIFNIFSKKLLSSNRKLSNNYQLKNQGKKTNLSVTNTIC